jgi:CRP-like cAMP-binding protein
MPGSKETVNMAGGELLKDFYLLRSEAGDDLASPTPLRTLVEAVAERRACTPGEIIFREGDVADAMYVVAQGEVDIVLADETVIRTQHAGEEFGEIPFFDGGRRSATARAGKHCDLIRVGYDALRSVLRERPECAALFYRNGAAFVAARLRKVTLDLHFERDRNRSHL